MAGYLHRIIPLEFPDLGGVDEYGKAIVWVRIRNPRTVPLDHLDPEVDGQGDMAKVYQMAANLIQDWHVWDATSDDDDPPLLASPPTPELVAKLPSDITARIAKEITDSTPQ
jgi:hypothetical protein